jgi:hypothetical protein
LEFSLKCTVNKSKAISLKFNVSALILKLEICPLGLLLNPEKKILYKSEKTCHRNMLVSSGCAGLTRSRSARTRGMAAASSQLPAGLSLTCSLINSWSQSTWRRRRPARTPTWTWVRWSRPTTRDCGRPDRGAIRIKNSRRRRRSSPSSWSWYVFHPYIALNLLTCCSLTVLTCFPGVQGKDFQEREREREKKERERERVKRKSLLF